MKLIAHDISFSFGRDEVLKNISFELNEGQILGVLGPNGGGKSTMLKLILGILKPSRGHFSLGEMKLENCPPSLFAYVAQEEKINSIFPLKLSDILSFYQKNLDIELKDLLKRFELEGKIDSFYEELSGGQKKRLQIVCALSSKPKILVLDEPTSGLDGQGQDQLLDLVNSYSKDKKTSVIVVDHNINEIIRHSDKILCLNKTHHWHNSKDFLTKDILQAIYHCEFEHLMIHQKSVNHLEHKHVHCQHDEGEEHGHD
jgi:zinc transport system ATP-binding protein